MGIEAIKEHVEQAVEKIKGDPAMLENFKKDPVKTLEGILGVDLPDEQVKAVAEAVKLKLGGGLGGLVKDIEGMFKK